MPSWRCPHCGTPQAETSRCWVCKRSSTSCATCRHFRRSIAGHLGYCGLDARRLPLRGDELRGCWTAPAASVDVAAAVVIKRAGPGTDASTHVEFIPVETGTRRRRAARRPTPGRKRSGSVTGPAAPAPLPGAGFWPEDA